MCFLKVLVFFPPFGEDQTWCNMYDNFDGFSLYSCSVLGLHHAMTPVLLLIPLVNHVPPFRSNTCKSTSGQQPPGKTPGVWAWMLNHHDFRKKGRMLEPHKGRLEGAGCEEVCCRLKKNILAKLWTSPKSKQKRGTIKTKTSSNSKHSKNVAMKVF